MIGAITYELTAEEAGSVEGFAGRLLHGAFFHHLSECSPAYSKAVHDEIQSKPFAVSPLIQPDIPHKMVVENHTVPVRPGTRFYWRVSALRGDIWEAALALKLGSRLQVGRIPFTVTAVYADGTHESGGLEPEELIAGALEAPAPKEISMHFRSPVTFRRDRLDYPIPTPEMVFASLADKWSKAGMPANIERDTIREVALAVSISDWRGRSQRVYFAQHHGASGCFGDFAYNLQALDEDNRRILLMLAQFATFSGVGRLTAQGFGQTRISL